MKKIKGACAVIAGSGYLPRVIYDYCLANEIECHVILLTGEADKKLFKDVKTADFLPYRVSKITDYLVKNKVNNIFLAGKVKRSNLALSILDKQGKELLSEIIYCGFNDKNIFQVITKLLVIAIHSGIRIIPGCQVQIGKRKG